MECANPDGSDISNELIVRVLKKMLLILLVLVILLLVLVLIMIL